MQAIERSLSAVSVGAVQRHRNLAVFPLISGEAAAPEIVAACTVDSEPSGEPASAVTGGGGEGTGSAGVRGSPGAGDSPASGTP